MAELRSTAVAARRTAAAAAFIVCLCSCAPQNPPETSVAPAGSSPSPARIEAKDMLGAAPEGVVQEGAGRLSTDGAVEVGLSAVAGGDYSVTAACHGAAMATLTVSQSGTGRPDVSALFPCGATEVQHVRLTPGSVLARIALPDGGPEPAGATAALRIAKR
jgi:hypothetical protein